jgi:3-ketosteroid 9alpha-monooxygenase subunit B
MGRPISGVVSAVRRETHDTATLELKAEGAPAYRAGQFLTIDAHQFPQIAPFLRYLEVQKGHTEPPRAYSLSSAPHEHALAITIKEEEVIERDYPPLLSPLLTHGLPPGSRLEFKGFDGLYTLPPEAAEHDVLLHLCSGSGIVPNFGLIKDALHRGLPGRHILLYENPTLEDVIFNRQLASLEAANPGRVVVQHFIHADGKGNTPGTAVQSRRFGRAEIEQALAGARNPLVFLCGPGVTSWALQAARKAGVPPAPRFIERIRTDLKSIGLDRRMIRTEVFG